MRPSRRILAIIAAATLGGCSLLGFEESDGDKMPPPGLFPSSDFGDGAFADPEPEPEPASSPPAFAANDSPFMTGPDSDFARFDGPASNAPPPLDYALRDRPPRVEPTYTPPSAPSMPDARAHAAYLGFLPQRADAEAYFDWLWMEHAGRLDGAQPYVSAAPDPNTGAPAVHIYAVNVTAAQAQALCDALAATQTPCTTIAR